VVSCPQTLKCAGKPTDVDGYNGDNFIFQIYEPGGLLNGEKKAITAEIEDAEIDYKNEVGLPDYPLRIKPQYGRYSWFGRTDRQVCDHRLLE
jgi:hypothetical protein